MDISQYKELFISEAQEHLEALNQSLVELEKDPGNPDVLTEIFRSAHTLKGMSATMGFDQLTELTHEMENVLDALRGGEIGATEEVVDLLFSCFDMLGAMVAAVAEESPTPIDSRSLIQSLREVYEGGRAPSPVAGRGPREAEKETAPAAGEEEEPEEKRREEAGGEKRILQMKIVLDKDCVLKSVRVFMVFKKLSQVGRILHSRPGEEELEEEKFDRSFEVWVESGEEEEKLKRALLTIAEVQEVDIRPVSPGELEEVREAALEEPVKAGAAPTPPVTESAAGPREEGPEEKGKEKAASAPPLRTQSVRVNISRLDNLMNLIGELVINRARLQEIASSYNIPELREALAQTSRLTAELQDEVMKTRMVPVEHIFNRFPRMVRDLAKSRGKEVDFVMEGKDIELDRTILDEISDPLMHLLRNAVDHGIDDPEAREAAGKPRRGRIKLAARRDRNYVSIEVTDDGRGVDLEKVFAAALERGMVSPEDRASFGPDEALRILSMPGFSTAGEVSGVSGRGVGLDVVKSKVESLGGMLLMETRPGEGTTFSMKLPLTLAIIQALLVRVGEETYAIPLAVVLETAVVSSHEVRYVSNQEVILLRDETLPLQRLSAVLDVPRDGEPDTFPVVVVEVASRSVALAVDELLGQQEIVITSLDRFLKGIRGFGGATILGTGEVALILDIPTLVG